MNLLCLGQFLLFNLLLKRNGFSYLARLKTRTEEGGGGGAWETVRWSHGGRFSGLLIPRWAYQFRGGPINPEAGLSIPRRAYRVSLLASVPSTLNPKPKPQALNPQPHTLNPNSKTLNPKP